MQEVPEYINPSGNAVRQTIWTYWR
jgi:hypothetical protein